MGNQTVVVMDGVQTRLDSCDRRMCLSKVFGTVGFGVGRAGVQLALLRYS